MTESLKLAAYQSARAELIQRIVLRDQALSAFVVAIGLFLGFIASKPADQIPPLARDLVELALPILSVGFTLVVLQHDLVIGSISAFLAENFATDDHWDNCTQYKQNRWFRDFRTFAQAMVLSVPVIYDVLTTWDTWWKASAYGIVIAGIFLLHLKVHQWRTRMKDQAISAGRQAKLDYGNR